MKIICIKLIEDPVIKHRVIKAKFHKFRTPIVGEHINTPDKCYIVLRVTFYMDENYKYSDNNILIECK
jgi:hypothetical protein